MRTFLVLLAGSVMATAAPAPAHAANPCAPAKAANPCAPKPPPPANPCAPADTPKLTDAQAAQTYQGMADRLQAGYAVSGQATTKEYRGWKRYNTVPYISETHGGRYVNNYANPIARDYGKFDPDTVLPKGAVIAKDSFGVGADGKAEAGPLFMMEKMAAGFNPDSGDWRYTMIMPDGRLFGQTKGPNDESVRFCAECHVAAGPGHTFFLPEEYRVKK